ncbi:MAG: basic amino acid/polyamine antiporter, family [Betaproteobacteria bacterium]|jgi:amino acid transporter|nr:basic amino acid/polyamine antiporter, family [Betaproteobacteria bacterium]
MSAPKPLLSVADGAFLMVGMVIGVGIFKAPSIVAGNTSTPTQFILVWLFGGLISLCGALVYAELASRHPGTGGEYTFLSRGFGPGAAFVFAWSRMTVIQTGAIAAVAFVFGDYASQILNLGERSTAIYAGLSVIALTALNFAGTLQSKTLQKVLETILIASLLGLAVAGIVSGGQPVPVKGPGGGALDLALLFVLFTYGGWNEAAYLGGEVRDPARNMMRILVMGIIAVTVLYVLVNIGYVAALGLQGVRDSKAVAADLMRAVAGDKGAVALALIVCISALTTINAAIFTGARTNYALGRDFPLFSALGNWREAGSTPANALVLQGVLALVLVGAGSLTPDGFESMVAYTAPVFWTFFLLTGLALVVLRRREGAAAPFRVPFYPLVTAAFCAMCAFMLYKSVTYIMNPQFGPKFGTAVLAGLLVMAIGIPLYFAARKQ